MKRVMRMTLEKLKRRLAIPSENTNRDTLLNDLLEDAQQQILTYTGRATLPASLASAQVELAAGAYYRLGVEGQSSHGEGGVSANYEGLPAHIRKQLDMLRVGKVG